MTHLAYRRGRKPRARTQPDHIARINTLTTTARNTWFAMLGVLAFVGVTLLGVQHIDFYGIDRATQLPLIGVSVPTRLFFYVAPVLTAAVYCYFHIYQIRLWDALSTAPAQIRGEPLSEHIHPWLLSSAALELRNFIRSGPRSAIGRWFWALPGISRIIQHPATPEPHCTTNRALSDIAAILSFGLAWIFGLVVLLYGWKQSLPAREFWMTATNAAAFYISGWVGADSLVVLWRRMRGISQEEKPWVWFNWFGVPASLCLFLVLGFLTLERTTDLVREESLPFVPKVIFKQPVFGLAELNLTEQSLVEHPKDWLGETTAKRDFQAIWCRREGVTPCSDISQDQEDAMTEEWTERRLAQIAVLRKPKWRPRNLKRANLENAFLPGLDLDFTNLDTANLNGANLENAKLRRAQLTFVNASSSQFQHANLSRANLNWADFIDAGMQNANLNSTRMNKTALVLADLSDASLIQSRMNQNNLFEANFTNANLSKAELVDIDKTNNAIFKGANFESASLSTTTFHTNDFSGASFKFAQLDTVRFRRTNLSDTSFFGARLKDSSLSFNTLNRVNMEGMVADQVGFANATMKGANLQSAWLNSPFMGGVDLTQADLRFVKLQGGSVEDSSFKGADLSFSFLAGTNERDLAFDESDWSASLNKVGGLRFVDLSELVFDDKTDWRWAFGDGTVKLPEKADALFGSRCHWIEGVAASDAVYFGRWRGWLEAVPVTFPFAGLGDVKPAWKAIAPPGFDDVTPIPPPEGCTPEVLPQ